MLKKKDIFDTINNHRAGQPEGWQIDVRSYGMKRSRVFAVLAGLLAVVLAGCGQGGAPETAESTTISVDRNGRITYYCVGEFDREYYSLSELTDMVNQEVARFNKDTGKEEAVVADRVETLPDDGTTELVRKVLIVYRFDGYSSFNRFNRELNKRNGDFFYGTVEEALKQGYTLKAPLKNVKDESMKTQEQLMQEAAGNLMITEEKAVIYCPGKVAFLSEGAVLKDEKCVDASGAEGTVYILLK